MKKQVIRRALAFALAMSIVFSDCLPAGIYVMLAGASVQENRKENDVKTKKGRADQEKGRADAAGAAPAEQEKGAVDVSGTTPTEPEVPEKKKNGQVEFVKPCTEREPLLLTYGTSAMTEPFVLRYGNEELSEEVLSSASAIPEESHVLDVVIDQAEASITFTPLSAADTPVKVRLSMETENYSFKRTVYVKINPLPLRIDTRSVSVSAPGKGDYTNRKIFDATDRVDVKVTLQAAEGLPVTNKAAEEISSYFENVVFYDYASGRRNVQGENERQFFDFAPGDMSPCKDIAEAEARKKYMIDTNEKAENIPLTIEKRTLHLAIAEGERPFRSLVYKKPLQTLVRVDDAGYDTGFAGTDSAKMAGFSFPKVVDTTAAGLTEENIKTGDTAVYGIHADALALDATTGNATGNYIFDLQDYVRGTLVIREEADARGYVTMNTAASSHVWEAVSEGKTNCYFGRDARAKFTLSGGYNRIYLADGTDVTDAGTAIPDAGVSGNVNEQSFYLTREEPAAGEETAKSVVKARTEPFQISFVYDRDAPNCGKIAFGIKNKVISDLAAAITFGIYDKKQIVADIAVTDDFAGVKDWSYYIAETDQDGTYEKLLENAVFQKGPENYRIPVGALPEGQAQEAGNNYIVFVKATDYVGNTRIYGSDGVVLENFHDISVGYTEKAAEGIKSRGLWNNVTYYSGDADLTMKAEENASEDRYYSGLEKMAYIVSRHYGDGRIVTDQEETVITKATEDHAVLPAFPGGVTLAGLREYCTITKTLHFVNDPKESQVITVSARAKDNAGNTMDQPLQYTLVLDSLCPVITSSYVQLNNHMKFSNGFYANSNVTYTVAVQERFLQTIKVDINGVSYTLAELEALEDRLGIASVMRDGEQDISQTTDKTVYHFAITFAADGEYTVRTTAVDAAGNSGSDTQFHFVIDTVRPKLALIYTAHHTDGTQEVLDMSKGRVYMGGTVSYITVTAMMTERNFEPKDVGLAVRAADSRKRAVRVADYAAAIHSGWRNKGYAGVTDSRYIFEWALPPIRVDANYDFTYSYTDLAGNALETVQTHTLTLDRAKPEGRVTVEELVNGSGTVTWEKLLHIITFGFFGKNRVSVSMTGEDETAGVASIRYLISDTALNRSSLEKRTNWKVYKARTVFKADQRLIVYGKIIDKAGNIRYISTDGIIVDHTDPAPEIQITPAAPGWNKGVYGAKDAPGFDVSVADPLAGGVCAGLKKITYKIVNESNGYTETGVLAELKKTAHRRKWTGRVRVDPDKFYSNDVRITVSAQDWSANTATSKETAIKIDNRAPVVKFAFDRDGAQNGRYYKNDKKLIVTVEERNFDESCRPRVTSSAGGGYEISGWVHRGETHTAAVTFRGDSDYMVSFSCHDLAGNESNTETLREFTVDKTAPVIQVAYDNNDFRNGSYYKAARTATITVTEHNFDPAGIVVTATASSGEKPKIGGWSSSGDTHRVKVRFDHDADYTLRVGGTDRAGNRSAGIPTENYTIDLTAPEIAFDGIKDQSANNGTVAPVIRIRDANFSAESTEITLTGANRGEQKVEKMAAVSSDDSGMTVEFENFAGGTDDIYILSCKSADKAGNERMAALRFSVNRDGSAYEIDKLTQELLDKSYTNRPGDLVITEINVDELELIEISYSLDGKIIILNEGTDYTVEKSGEGGRWKRYVYRIHGKCFEAEGTYIINLYSEDAAHNAATNKTKAKTLAFTVDKTAPAMAVANLADGGRYKEESHSFILNVKDNILLDYAEVYLDGKLMNTYHGNDLAAAGGEIRMTIGSSNQYHTIELAACDRAGNVSREVYDPEKNRTVAASYRVLVTANEFVQFVNNRPLFIGSVLLAVAAVFFVGLLIKKRTSGLLADVDMR